jgi:hypothetical protein
VSDDSGPPKDPAATDVAVADQERPTPARKLDHVEREAAETTKVSKRASMAAARVELCRRMLAMGYSTANVVAWLERDTVDKTWKVSRATAHGYVNKAMAVQDAEIVQPKNRKQARARAWLVQVVQRSMELAHDPKLTGKAAQNMAVAVAAIDKIARIDGSYEYDPSTMIPADATPRSPEEAIALVNHAKASIELAQRRGAIVVSKDPQPTVIDAESTEVADPEDAESTDAN